MGTIELAYCFDDKIAKYAQASARSVVANCSSGLTTHFYDISTFKHLLPAFRPRSTIKSMAMYGRFLLPDLLPDVDRIIYLDVDTIMKGDIAELWNMDLHGNVIAMAPDCFGHSIKKIAGLSQGGVDAVEVFGEYNCDVAQTAYLSGQMVIDAKAWRENDIGAKTLEIASRYSIGDLLAINIACQDKIEPLSHLWSAPASYLRENMMADNPKLVEKDYTKAKLIHYHGSIKPWMTGFRHKKLQQLWEKYAKV